MRTLAHRYLTQAILLVSTLAIAPLTSAGPCVSPPAGLVGWWPAEGNGNDVIGGDNGVLEGGVSFAPGKVGQGFHLDGTNGYVQIPDSDALKPAHVTVEAWVWLDPSITTPRGEYIVFKRNSWTYLFEGYALLKESRPNGDGTYTDRFSFVVTSGGNQVITYSTTAVQRGVWYHVAGSYDGNTSTLWVNGVAEASAFAGFALDYGTRPVFIGTSGEPDPYNGKLAGIIDEASIYNRALSASEIAAIYNAGSAGKCGPAAPGCATYPDFNSTSGLNLIGSAAVANGVLRLTPATAGQTGDAWLTTQQPCAGGFDTTFHFAISDLGNIYGNEPGGDGFTFAVQNLGPTNNAWAMGDTNQFVAVFFNTFWNWPGCTCPDVSDNSVGILVNQTYIAQTDLNPLGINMSDGAAHSGRVNFNGTSLTVWVDGVLVLSNVPLPGLLPGVDASGQGWVGFTAGTGAAYENHDILDWSFCVTSNAPPPPVVPVISSFVPITAPVGAPVTISGTNFSATAVSNLVYFGAVRANVVLASATSLTVLVPPGATYAPITVTVNGLTAWANAPFMPTFNGGTNLNALAPRLDLPASDGPGMVVYGDIDGDGKADLVVNAGNHVVSIYRNISAGGTVTAGSFAPRVDLMLASGVQNSMVIADVDGDGKLDIVVLDDDANQVTILRNLSIPGSITTDSFAAPVSLPTGSNPRGLVVRDLDGDGHTDIATANWGDSTISIFRNLGTPGSLSAGSFAAAMTIPSGANPQTMAAGDLDGDGKPDLVAANNNYGTSDSVSVLRNLSVPGTLSFAGEVALAGLQTSFCVALGDLDGDGKLDLVVSSFINGQAVSVYRNVSTPGSLTAGSFAPRVDFSTGGWGNAVALGDLDGDGKPDLAVVTQLPDHLSVFKNVSAPGSFTASSLAPRVDYPTGWNPNGVAIGDLDGDGRPDIAFAVSYGATLSIYQNQTPLAAGPPVITSFTPPTGANGTVVTLSGTNFSATAGSDIVYFGAVRANVLSASATSLTVSVPPGATLGPITVTVNGLVGYSAQVFVPTFAGNASNLSNNSFAPSLNLTVGPPGTGPAHSAIADLDGDGRPDLVIENSSSHTISIFRNVSSAGPLTAASFAAPFNLPAIRGSGDNPYGMTVADVDSDGKLDIVVCDRVNNQLLVYRNISSPGTLDPGSFASPVAFPVGADPRGVRVADLDGDGRPDIACANYGSSSISILRNLGVGGVLSSNSFAPAVSFASGAGAYDVAIADLDGDGKPDLAAPNQDGFSVSVFRNLAVPGIIDMTSFAGRVDLPAPDGNDTIAVADLDGDGKLDLVIGSYRSETISVYRNISAAGTLTPGSFESRVDFSTGNWTHTVALADFNGDGKPDICVVGELPSYLSIFQNVGAPGSFSVASLAPRVDFGSGWNAWGVAAGDLDGDGRPDVIFCNTYDDNISIYQNQTTDSLVAMPDALTAAGGIPVTFAAAKLTLNDIDSAGYPITVVGVGGTSAQGGIVVFSSGQVTYTPPPNFAGIDSFTYTISDDHGNIAIGTVTATIGNGGLISANVVYGPVLAGGNLIARFAGIPGLTYTVEAAASPAGPWSKVASLTAPSSDQGLGVGVFQFSEPFDGQSSRFYRTVYPAY